MFIAKRGLAPGPQTLIYWRPPDFKIIKKYYKISYSQPEVIQNLRLFKTYNKIFEAF
jgi:hypothetical protein